MNKTVIMWVVLTKNRPTATGKNASLPLLLPLYHSMQNAHITITLNKQGELINASLNNQNSQPTIIPVTEASGGRTSGACAHPLCDKLQYVAGDNADYFPPEESPAKRTKQLKTLQESYEQYEQQLSEWAAFDPGNVKLNAVLAYIRKKSLITDLINGESYMRKIPPTLCFLYGKGTNGKCPPSLKSWEHPPRKMRS